jgi:transcription termination factor Rho
MVIEKAKRLVEHGRDVVILLDSITRLARAYNTSCRRAARSCLAGSTQCAAQAKKFLGAAATSRIGGSLTILGTALIDTGSRMDEVIFEEFKATGQYGGPLWTGAWSTSGSSGHRHQPLGNPQRGALLGRDVTKRIWVLRKLLAQLNPVEAMEFLVDKVEGTKSNNEFWRR